MPKIKQPDTLENMALVGVADWIAKIGETVMPCIEEIAKNDNTSAKKILASKVHVLRSLIEYNLPWMLFDRFADEVFRSISELLERTKQSQGFRGSMSKFISKMNVAVTLTEVLLTKNLTKLHLDGIPKMLRHVFYVKFSMLKGLEHLNLGSLSGGWKTADMEPTIILGIKSLHNLKSLTINYDCTDNILEAICLNCPFLESLDLSSSKSITNQSVSYIIKCNSLKQIQLNRTGVTLEGFTKILLNCPKLEDMGRYDELGRVLEYIDLINSEAGPFNIRKYVSRYVTSNHLQLLVQLCPLLYSISLFHNSLLSDLMILIGLGELSELKLMSCDFFGDQVKQVLEVKGCNLVHLHLEHVDQLDLNALMYISQFCPTLESLTFYNCVLIQHTSLFTRKVNWYPFHSLHRLSYVCEGNDEHLEFVLSNAVNIRYVHLGSTVKTSDSLFDRILDKNPFLFLEQLRILKSEELTMLTVNRLMNGCGRLHTLTELECWSKITEDDLETIRNHIKHNNLNLDITSYQRYES
ncbi:uncharacterized protein LOC143916541 [Arctopsyche grandis]|uniref:uncharacterized protein LOC143916541 n=1 Tax=Arctopsyche grandis TaxID=121162 RepID=UPI00406D9527